MLTVLFRNTDGGLRSGWRIVVMCLLAIALVALVNVVWRGLGLPGMQSGGPWWFLLFATLVSTGILAVVLVSLRFMEGVGPEAIHMPFNRSAVWMTLLGIALGAAPIACVVVAALVGGYGTLATVRPPTFELAAMLLPMLCAGFLLAAWEEIVLRGYLLRQLTLGINAMAAALITGTVFGLLHAGNPGANWEGLVYTAVGGVLMAWLVLRTGSLWLLIGYHFGWNAVSSEVFGLQLSGFDRGASLLSIKMDGPDWLTGGSYGFEASVPVLLAEIAVLAMALRVAGARRSEDDRYRGQGLIENKALTR